MTNPYESTDKSDPFRERSSPAAQELPPQPATATNYNLDIPSNPINTHTVPSYRDGYDSGARQEFVDSVSVPMGGANGAPAAAAQAAPEEPPASPKPTSKFWTMEFYQQFFDVDTRQVLIRISNTLIPLNPPDFLMDRHWHYSSGGDGAAATTTPDPAAPQEVLVIDGVKLSRHPDLYGPFWICTTLWMTLGIASNVMGKIAATRAEKTDWQYDFSVASVACLVMYLYCFVFGTAVWGIMAWRNMPVSVVDTICLYGYSMFIFILTAILCMIPVTALQWVFCILGGLWSTAYLLTNFWRIWQTWLERNWFIGIVAVVSVFHMGLTLSFKFYFFKYSY